MRRSVNETGLLNVALRVLKVCIEHRTPSDADVEVLKTHAMASEADLPIDDVASRIIKRELERRKNVVVS
jgi:hypothetical protein